MKYNTYMISDICTFIDYRGKTPPKTSSGIPLITAKIIKNNVIQEPKEFIDESFYDEWMRRGIPKKGDIVFTTEAPLGEVARITSDSKMAFAQRVIILEPNEEILDASYLFYALQDRLLKNRILARSSGTTVFGIKSKELKKVEIDLPCLKIQKKISNVLLAIDEKISINNLINDNLLQQAQALYVELFISNASATWQTGHLSDIITVRYGKDHKKLAEGPYPVYGSGGIMRYVDKYIYDKESVLIPRKGSLNNVMYINEPFWSVDTMFFTEMKLPNVAKFVFHFIKRKDLAALNAGSAVPSMTTDILNSIELKIPDAYTLAKFEDIVTPMYFSMRQNIEESDKLAEIRDYLLPHLISGELDVSNLDF